MEELGVDGACNKGPPHITVEALEGRNFECSDGVFDEQDAVNRC
jgi:hypothetical protein